MASVKICAMKPVLCIRDLSLNYRLSKDKRVRVLHDANLIIKAGETVGLLGPSGSGKTSLLRCILGMPMPEAEVRCAELQFEGSDMTTMTARQLHALRRNRMGVIFQDPAHRLSPFRRIGGQMGDAFPGGHHRADILSSLSSVGLADPARIASSYAHELSGGECQRVAIAQALAAKPSLLLADEPSSALDTVSQRQILDLLLGVRSELGIAMLVISHDPALLSALADRILVLRAGALDDYAPARSATFHTHRHFCAAEKEKEKPLLKVSDVHLAYGSYRGWMKWRARHTPHPALRGSSLQVEQGECVAVVGASGSGKSTLARCIAGIDFPQSGEISLSGEVLPQARPLALRARLQLILQDTVGALNPRLTVAQILAEPLSIHRHRTFRGPWPHARRGDELERIPQVLASVSLPLEYLERRPAQLSGGERQRVAIARALVLRPSILLLDEALTGLDRDLQQSMLVLLDELRTQIGLTCVHFSHDLGQMLRVTDRIAVMDEGRIVECHAAAQFSRLASHPASLRLLHAILDPPADL